MWRDWSFCKRMSIRGYFVITAHYTVKRLVLKWSPTKMNQVQVLNKCLEGGEGLTTYVLYSPIYMQGLSGRFVNKTQKEFTFVVYYKHEE